MTGSTPARRPPRERAIEVLLAGLALGLVALLLAPPSSREADPRPSLLGPGAWSALADNATRAHYDDGYYYLVIARNLARGDGSTFDGLRPTSGYHPLWLLALVPLVALAPGPAAALVASAALQALLLAGATVVAYRALRLQASAAAAVLGVVLWLQFALVQGAAVSGVEWALHALLVLAAAALWVRDFGVSHAMPRPASRARGAHSRNGSEAPHESDAPPGPGDPWPYARLGLVLALLFLARVDTLPLAGCLGAWFALRRTGPRRLAAFAAPLALAVAAYAAVNLRVTGRAAPISAAVKREWSQALLARDPHFLGGGWTAAKLHQLAWPVTHQRRAFWLYLAVGTLGIGAACVASAWAERRRRRTVPRRGALRPRLTALGVWTPFAVFAWLQWLGLVLVYHHGYSYAPWYFAVQPWLAVVLVTLAADGAGGALTGRGRVAGARASTALVALAAAGLAAFTVRGVFDARARRRAEGEAPLYTVARAVRERVPPEAHVGAWNAGQIAFFSGRRVVNLDGLVNSWDFHEHGRRDLCAYFRAARLEYLADSFPSSGIDGLPGGPLPCRDRLRLLWSEAGGAPRAPRLQALYGVDLRP